MIKKQGLTYKSAGVDIDAANNFVERIKPLIRMTSRSEVVGGIGGFGGAFALDIARYRNPLLIGATDGVGTKLKIAQLLSIHNTVGIDLVAMSVNDVIVQGAEPLFFLDYLAVGKLVTERETHLVAGVVEGCRQANCALLGGETAEMPGLYGEDEYDLAGFCVGAVEREKLIDGSTIEPGDVLIGLASSGLHSNGFSLARRVFLPNDTSKLAEYHSELACTLGEALLEPTRIYVRSLLQVLERVPIKGLVHITGGGFFDNIPRIVKEPLGVVIERNTWEIPPLFKLLQRQGGISDVEMFRTFNMGIGMIAVLAAADANKALSAFIENGEKASIIGTVVPKNTKNTANVRFSS